MIRIGVFSLAAAALLALAAAPASAQLKKPTGNLGNDLGITNQKPVTILAPADAIADLSAKIEAVKADTITSLVSALNEADADAGALTNKDDPASFRDPISHACYPAQIKFLQSIPAAQPITSPAPFNLIVLFQRKRDFVAQVKAGLPVYLKIGCAPLLGDEISIFVQTMALVGVKVGAAGLTAAFPALAPVTLPALTIAAP